MGSKNRIAKHILPIMLSNRKHNQYWVEPFVGGGNMIDKVDGLRLGADADRFVIDAMIDIRDNVHLLPKNNTEFTEEMYKNIRKSDTYRHKGYVGFATSYSGKWLGGWCRGEGRDYVQEAYNNAVKQSPKLQGVIFQHCAYDELEIPDKSIIYCDPPYEGTTRYKNNFNHFRFWEWCRKQSRAGHTVFVSEYNAPNDFECIWSKELSSSLTKNTGSKKGIEKLFIFKEGYGY